MKKYEIMYIIKATIGDDEIKSVAKSFEDVLISNGAKILSSKDMGQKELAYEINKEKTGYYYLLEIEANDDKAINEFDRLTLINKNVIRHLITRIEK